ncbi:MAG TPA: STAS domain-containing protein [Candidatus Binatia bacterium]|nr:STAS domain-containing protein [Candidatus Binatia bacterium]
MLLQQRREAGADVAALAGRVDHANAEELRAALAPVLENCRAGGPPLVLDLSALEYISSAGLRVLMLAARQAKEQGGHIVVAALQPLVREVFEITRFDAVFPVFDSVPAALAG